MAAQGTGARETETSKKVRRWQEETRELVLHKTVKRETHRRVAMAMHANRDRDLCRE